MLYSDIIYRITGDKKIFKKYLNSHNSIKKFPEDFYFFEIIEK
jgi:hypothetical protein